MKIITEKLGIDIYNAIEAASTNPLGFKLSTLAQDTEDIVFLLTLLYWPGEQISGADAKFINSA